jgi:hypothetical protein
VATISGVAALVLDPKAKVPLIQATDAGHAFEFTQLEERLATARRGAEALMLRLLGLPRDASGGSK